MIPPVWNPIKILDLNHIRRSLDMMAKQVPTSSPWTADKADEWDSLTVEHYLDKTCWTRFSKDLVRLFVRTTLTAEPHEVSLLFLLWYINCGGGIDSLCSITNGAQEKKIEGGSQQVCEKLAKKLEGKIKLSNPVIAIEQQNDVAIVTDLHGKKYKAKYIISAIPQTYLNHITFRPPLPAVKQQLIQRMPMGAVFKTIMFYPTVFWRNFGLNGSSVTNFGPVAYTIDDTKPNEESPAIMGFIDADRAREMNEMTREKRLDTIKEYYAEAFKSNQFFNPIGYVEKNWMEEDYLGGVFYMPPGALSKYGRMLRNPIQRVHFAGTETATQWVGYMDGAVQAGERAAKEIQMATHIDQLAHITLTI
ncbi:hypothetical protein KUTeg_012508 [Tegillarca granosa]|uniref:Amine oxidase n=1 Tax=Tegillarca granosa TaxID=220873 RepID=A0ABQ9EZS1_TEGGR|nr:hypothetical protein KUTeg_012508 [Tegillarca granosa]